jgi:hypothetical protein
MPIGRWLQNSAFEPSEIDALTEAFETICHELKLGKDQEALREKAAQKVFELAELGERNPEAISQCVLKDMRGTSLAPVGFMGLGVDSGLASQHERHTLPSVQAKTQS